MSSPLVDIFLIYQFLQRLVTPWKETPAFKLGLIDDRGKKLHKAQTPEEKRAMGYFDRLVYNLKRLLQLVPGGGSKLGTYAAALLLVREQDNKLVNDSKYLEEQYTNVLKHVDLDQFENLQKLIEDIGAPANATGAEVAGTGDDLVHWKKRKTFNDIVRRKLPKNKQ